VVRYKKRRRRRRGYGFFEQARDARGASGFEIAMSKKERKRRRKIRKIEERSDRRTAEFLMHRLEEVQTEVGDLIPDLQTFEHWCEIAQLTFVIRMLKDMRKKYRKIVDGQAWQEEE
jgi:hypothetical protein